MNQIATPDNQFNLDPSEPLSLPVDLPVEPPVSIPDFKDKLESVSKNVAFELHYFIHTLLLK